jgi:hypothetical protein
MLQIENDGPDIRTTNYWETDPAAAGLVYASCNAGAIRLLLPPAKEPDIPDMTRGVEYVILSRGPWPAQGLPEAVEILFEDRSDSPYALHLSPESFDLLPAEPPEGREWRLGLWTAGPRKRADLPVRFRRVQSLPWLRPWEPTHER